MSLPTAASVISTGLAGYPTIFYDRVSLDTLESNLFWYPACDLKVMPEMARRVYDGDDVVIASRYVRGGGYVNFPWQRTWGSYAVNVVLSIFFHVRGITDYTIFYRAFRAAVVQQALQHFGSSYVTTKSFAANLEVLLRVLPYSSRFSEVPLRYDYGLKKSQSKMNPVKTLREYQGLIFKRLLRKI